MRFLLRFIGEPIAGEGDFSVAEPTLLVSMEDCMDNIDRLLTRADDDELANEIPVFCRALDRRAFEA